MGKKEVAEDDDVSGKPPNEKGQYITALFRFDGSQFTGVEPKPEVQNCAGTLPRTRGPNFALK